jgi:hypothetical protein
MKKRINQIIFLFGILMIAGSISGSSIVVNAPISATYNSNFLINITASDVPSDARWGAIINLDITGGCLFSGKTYFKDVMLSTGGITKSASVSTPASGNCYLSGYFQFAEDINPTYFTDKQIVIYNCNSNSECNDGINCTTDVCLNHVCSRTAITTCSLTKDSCCASGCGVANDSDCTATCPNNICGTNENCGTCASDCACTGSSICTPLNVNSDSKGCLCTPNWICIDWSACSSSLQTRTCNDSNNCNSIIGKPAESQSCNSGSTGGDTGGNTGGGGTSGGGTGGGNTQPKANKTSGNKSNIIANQTINNIENNTADETPLKTDNHLITYIIIIASVIVIIVVLYIVYINKKKRTKINQITLKKPISDELKK